MSRRYSATTGIHKFRQRGAEILRIEALSDAVFAFAVSLLAVSLEVPQHFHELQIILKGGLSFFATVSLLFCSGTSSIFSSGVMH